MDNFKKYYNTLELNKILSQLADNCALCDAAILAQNLTPSYDISKINSQLNKTNAAFNLLMRSQAPTFNNAVNNTQSFERAKVGGVLNFKELLQIGDTLSVIRSVKNWRNSIDTNINTDIDYLFEKLQPNKYFEEKIFTSIKNEDDLNDDASIALRDIRRKIISLSSSIRERLDRIIRNQNTAKFLQETIITQRDGRFVVPVKSEYKGEFPGIVHDSSSSGATLFIEPMPIVEINNDLRVLKLKEQEEIERILSELSSEAASFADTITTSYNTLVKLCLIFAKADLAHKMKASLPILNNEGRIVLKNARHPLIAPEKVVPISLSLGVDYNSLIITGPNTGGKTVTLKTIGLFTLMAMCGLMIPADDMSEICVFDKILVDIGDEQSIEQSLSTFSSHMVNIVSILQNATPFSLVLLDELGAGTDPIEGAALAKSILINLANKGSRIVATTHYAELKAYALDTDSVENASCEFNVETLKPTYRLLIGVPGRSNAFAISSKLGISSDIIDNAKNFISDDNRRFENIISSLEGERQKLESERKAIEELRINIEKDKIDSQRKNAEINEKYNKIVDKARSDAENIISSARIKSDQLLNEIDDIKRSINKENASQMASKARNFAKKSINDMMNEANPVVNIRGEAPTPESVNIGDRVMLNDLQKDGEIIEIKGKKIRVSAGNIKIWTDICNLSLLKQNKSKPKSATVTGIRSGATRIAVTDLDMRGMSVDEGIIELERFLDNALLSGLNTVTVIHGKGTGVLRKAVHKHLSTSKVVKTYRLGIFGEGENGVTIVELDR